MSDEQEEVVVARAKVATIPAPSQLAINAGSDSDVQLGDSVTLFRQVEVFDPDTNESLGTVRYPKLRLVVTLLSGRFSIATATDRHVSGDSWNQESRLMDVTTDVLSNAEGTVIVSIGELALVRRARYSDPPF